MTANTTSASTPAGTSLSLPLPLPVLAMASFASMASMRLCDAMLPAIGASFGRRVVDCAATITAFAIAYGLMQLVYGPLGDRHGKPRVIALAALACGVGAFCAALAGDLGLLIISRALMGGAAAGIIPMTMAWIGDQVPWEQRQLVLARLLGYTVTGMMAGAWAGGAIADLLGWRWAFVLVGALLLATGATVLHHTRGAVRQAAVAAPLPYVQQVRQLLAARWARQLLLVTLVEGALGFGVMAFVPSVLHEHHGLSLTGAGAVLALFGLGGLLYVRAAQVLLRRLQAQQLAAAGGCVLGASFVLLAVMPHWAWALPACLLAGLGFYMLHGTLQACATQLSATQRGLAVSLFACVLFIGQSLGVSLSAWAMTQVDTRWCFAVAGLGLAALGLGFAALMQRAGPASGRTP